MVGEGTFRGSHYPVYFERRIHLTTGARMGLGQRAGVVQGLEDMSLPSLQLQRIVSCVWEAQLQKEGRVYAFYYKGV